MNGRKRSVKGFGQDFLINEIMVLMALVFYSGCRWWNQGQQALLGSCLCILIVCDIVESSETPALIFSLSVIP